MRSASVAIIVRASLLWVAAAFVAAVSVLGCSGAASHCTFPPAPAGAGAIVYVCPGEAGDGSSPASPVGSIGQGLAISADGTVILLAAGTYVEKVTVTRRISLVGGSDPRLPDGAAAVIAAPRDHALIVTGASGVVLQGLWIADPAGSGIWLDDGGGATVTSCRVDGSTGVGVLATDGARLTLRASVVSGSTLGGVYIGGGEAAVEDSDIIGNAGGGIRIDDSVSPAGVQIRDSRITDNEYFGVALFNSVATLDGNDISDNAGTAGIGVGVLVAGYHGKPPSSASLRGNDIRDNLTIGVLFARGAAGTVADNHIAGNGSQGLDAGRTGAGIWLQGGAGGPGGVELTGNTVVSNRGAGIVLLDGARAVIEANSVGGTPETKPWATASNSETLGDGVSVAGGASAVIGKNLITDCFRAGVIASGAVGALTTLTANTIGGNGYAVVLQDQEPLGAIDGNTMTGNVTSNAVEEVPASTYVVYDTPIPIPQPEAPAQ